MRTTVTLDPDVDLLIKRAMHERGLTFKQALNQAVREGLGPTERHRAFRQRTFDLGEPAVDLTKALRVASELEDDELVRDLRTGR